MNYIIIEKEIFKQLSNDEFLVYCFARFQMKGFDEYIFSSSIVNYYLNAMTRKPKDKLNNATKGLVEKGLIDNPVKDVYIIRKKDVEGYYFALNDIEFEALNNDSNLLRYFCFILSCLDNNTQQFAMSNSFIQNGFGALYDRESKVGNKTVIKYNRCLEELDLIKVISNKKQSNVNDRNIIKRVHVADNYKNKISSNEKADKVTTKAEAVSKSNSTKNVENIKDYKEAKANIGLDKERINKLYADAIGFNEHEIAKIHNSQYKIIEEVGEENFIKIVKNFKGNDKYRWIFESREKTAQEISGKFLGMVLKNLQSGIEELKKEQRERDDFYFVRHKTKDNVAMDKKGLGYTINELDLNYEKVINELLSGDLIVTDEVDEYIKDYIKREKEFRAKMYDGYQEVVSF